MADGRNAEWYQVDDDWVVAFEGPEGVYLDTYRTSDFDDVQAVVDAWVNDGKLPWMEN
jgi:hypothetical protein